MKITKIQQQQRAKDRYSIYVDEKYAFSVNEYQLIELKIHSGDEISQKQLDYFATESQFGKAYERTINYLMIRPRSEKEVRDYLTRTYMYPKPKSYVDKSGQRHFKKQTVDKEQIAALITRVMDRLQTKGHINDESFAKTWIESRMLHKKPSRRKLEQELMQKGVSQSIIATQLQNFNLNEKGNLLELVNKKRKLIRYQDDTKLIAYLLRQGFNYDDIKDALA